MTFYKKNDLLDISNAVTDNLKKIANDLTTELQKKDPSLYVKVKEHHNYNKEEFDKIWNKNNFTLNKGLTELKRNVVKDSNSYNTTRTYLSLVLCNKDIKDELGNDREYIALCNPIDFFITNDTVISTTTIDDLLNTTPYFSILLAENNQYKELIKDADVPDNVKNKVLNTLDEQIAECKVNLKDPAKKWDKYREAMSYAKSYIREKQGNTMVLMDSDFFSNYLNELWLWSLQDSFAFLNKTDMVFACLNVKKLAHNYFDHQTDNLYKSDIINNNTKNLTNQILLFNPDKKLISSATYLFKDEKYLQDHQALINDFTYLKNNFVLNKLNLQSLIGLSMISNETNYWSVRFCSLFEVFANHNANLFKLDSYNNINSFLETFLLVNGISLINNYTTPFNDVFSDPKWKDILNVLYDSNYNTNNIINGFGYDLELTFNRVVHDEVPNKLKAKFEKPLNLSFKIHPSYDNEKIRDFLTIFAKHDLDFDILNKESNEYEIRERINYTNDYKLPTTDTFTRQQETNTENKINLKRENETVIQFVVDHVLFATKYTYFKTYANKLVDLLQQPYEEAKKILTDPEFATSLKQTKQTFEDKAKAFIDRLKDSEFAKKLGAKVTTDLDDNSDELEELIDKIDNLTDKDDLTKAQADDILQGKSLSEVKVVANIAAKMIKLFKGVVDNSMNSSYLHMTILYVMHHRDLSVMSNINKHKQLQDMLLNSFETHTKIDFDTAKKAYYDATGITLNNQQVEDLLAYADYLGNDGDDSDLLNHLTDTNTMDDDKYNMIKTELDTIYKDIEPKLKNIILEVATIYHDAYTIIKAKADKANKNETHEEEKSNKKKLN